MIHKVRLGEERVKDGIGYGVMQAVKQKGSTLQNAELSSLAFSQALLSSLQLRALLSFPPVGLSELFRNAASVAN